MKLQYEINIMIRQTNEIMLPRIFSDLCNNKVHPRLI